jgi:hypothetical protein
VKGRGWIGWVVVIGICMALNLANYLGYIKLPFWLF